MKTTYSSLYPSIILENNLAPNTQIGKVIIEDPDNPDKSFGLNEHPDMFSNKDEVAKYSRGGEFLENFMSGNPLEFCRRWMYLGDIHDVLADLEEFYKYNKYRGKPLKYDYRDSIYYIKSNTTDAVIFDDIYMTSPAVTFNNTLSVEEKKELEKNIRKGAVL